MNRIELEKLSKSQLIELLLLKKEKEKSEKSIIIHRPVPAPITKKPVIIPKEKKKPVIILKEKKKPVIIPKEKKKPVIIPKEKKKPAPIRKVIPKAPKKSYILDEPIPEKEIPKGQKILKPSIINNIKNVVKWGKKQVENWGDWLMKGVKWGMKQVENLGENLGEWFMNLEAPQDDETEVPQDDETELPEIKQLNQAMQGYTQSFEISIINDKDPLLQLQLTRNNLRSHISSILESLKGLKFVQALKVTLSKITDDEGTTTKTHDFFSTPQTIINNTEIQASLEESKQIILNKIAIWISEGSGWTVESVDKHYLNVVKYTPLEGSSYIKMPKDLRNRSLINIKNYDHECFRWCHIRHLNPQETNPQRIKKDDREYIKNLNYSGIEFPVTIKQYNKIEKQNNININVFSYSNGQIFPIYVSRERNEDMLNLLLLTKTAVRHYILIKDFNTFMHNITKHSGKKNFCMFCLQHFSSERILNNHKENCIIINGIQGITMPNKDENILKFKGFYKQLPVPFVIYADFEAITEKIDSCQRNDNKSYTEAYQNHRDCGYGYKVVCCYDDKYTKEEKIYRGEKAVYKFMEAMLKEVKYCINVIQNEFNKPLKMTTDDEEKFQKADRCHICEQKYKKQDVRVRDHCHITGKYRGSAHQYCNLQFQITDKIPVIFHNLRGYDSHFIIQEIGEIIKKNTYKVTGKDGKEKVKQMNINVIPNNMEKYMAIMLGEHLTFIDSFQFMSSSLDKLVSNLPKESLKYTSKRFQGMKLNLMAKKGVYPYDYMDSFDKFNEQLPTKEDFFSILNNEHITDEDYNHALKVWKTFSLKNMGEYHDLYLTSDILLLADVFENFRKTCLEYYKLDPCHYFTSPGLSWDAMLRMTNIKLELMTDVDMFLFIEKGLRGGISYIANRYGKANNKYMKEYDEKVPSKYIMYLDANNLYGWAMSKYLPTGGFKWLKIDGKLNLDLYKEDSKKGLILEVDLEYPKELHNLHNDYPLASEKIKVTKDMLSDYSQKIAEKYKISTGLVHKLIPTLRNKEKYVLHYRNLQLYIDLGLKLTKIHRVLEFNQSPWLKQYIDFNTQKRTNAKNPFEKDFFKLMNNSVFGKTMENIRKRVDVKLVTDEKKLLRLAAKPTYVSTKIINENLIIVHKIKETITLNKPAYVGMCILDLSKTLMYNFHYNNIKQKYGSKAKLLFTDTDSLTYEIEAEDVYSDFWKDKHMFDNSDYTESSPYFDKTNKKVIGKFKDEAAGVPVCEFVGLRSKMYSYIKDNQKGEKTAKGIKKNIIKNNLKHINYKETLFDKKQMHHKMKTIRSKNHQLGSYEINKVSLSCYDDKRYLLEDGINSYAYGHYAINEASLLK